MPGTWAVAAGDKPAWCYATHMHALRRPCAPVVDPLNLETTPPLITVHVVSQQRRAVASVLFVVCCVLYVLSLTAGLVKAWLGFMRSKATVGSRDSHGTTSTTDFFLCRKALSCVSSVSASVTLGLLLLTSILAAPPSHSSERCVRVCTAAYTIGFLRTPAVGARSISAGVAGTLLKLAERDLGLHNCS